MKTGTARKGMRIRIVGNHNSHGFSIGQVITLGAKTQYFANAYGCAFMAPSKLGAIFVVREIDMEPAGAKVV